MIIVKIKGGLGNQLFQYAAGKSLAEKYNVALKLDLSHIKADPKGAYTKRELELNDFNVVYTEATEEEVKPYISIASNKYLRVLCRKFPALFKKAYITESGNLFHANFNSYKDNTYLDGFWQSEKYFSAIRPQLLKELTIREVLPEALNVYLQQIKNSNSVSLHVRRGDYVNNQTVNSFHGTMDLSYYENALNSIKAKYSVDKLFIFSDDIVWCKQNMKFSIDTIFVEFESAVAGSMEMMLMSNCKHNIIANSSFSWWAAWLNQNNEKMVVAPKKWFINIDNPDIYPQTWIKL